MSVQNVTTLEEEAQGRHFIADMPGGPRREMYEGSFPMSLFIFIFIIIIGIILLITSIIIIAINSAAIPTYSWILLALGLFMIILSIILIFVIY